MIPPMAFPPQYPSKISFRNAGWVLSPPPSKLQVLPIISKVKSSAWPAGALTGCPRRHASPHTTSSAHSSPQVMCYLDSLSSLFFSLYCLPGLSSSVPPVAERPSVFFTQGLIVSPFSIYFLNASYISPTLLPRPDQVHWAWKSLARCLAPSRQDPDCYYSSPAAEMLFKDVGLKVPNTGKKRLKILGWEQTKYLPISFPLKSEGETDGNACT